MVDSAISPDEVVLGTDVEGGAENTQPDVRMVSTP